MRSLAACSICRLNLLVTFALLLAGCQRNSAPANPNSSEVLRERRQFPDAAEALAALTDAYQRNQARDVKEIEEWLRNNGDLSITELSRAAKSEETPIERRITACRALAKLGNDSIPVLMELTEHSIDQLRYRAAESLSFMSPSSQRLVEALEQLLQREDVRLRSYAVRGLGNAEGLAKHVVPDLTKILNDYSQNDSLRNEAKAALKKIDPRRGLMGLQNE